MAQRGELQGSLADVHRRVLAVMKTVLEHDQPGDHHQLGVLLGAATSLMTATWRPPRAEGATPPTRQDRRS
jgi:hypothetical protein